MCEEDNFPDGDYEDSSFYDTDTSGGNKMNRNCLFRKVRENDGFCGSRLAHGCVFRRFAILFSPTGI
jgi:hypothetical protein